MLASMILPLITEEEFVDYRCFLVRADDKSRRDDKMHTDLWVLITARRLGGWAAYNDAIHFDLLFGRGRYSSAFVASVEQRKSENVCSCVCVTIFKSLSRKFKQHLNIQKSPE